MESVVKTTTSNILWILAAFLLLGVMVYGLRHPPGKPLETPEQSNQEKNLEVLKAVKQNDLVLCVIDKSGTTQVVRAIIADNNNGTAIFGRELDRRMVLMPTRYDYSTFEHCKVEAQRDMPTSNMSAHLGNIFLYGLNPPREHPIR